MKTVKGLFITCLAVLSACADPAPNNQLPFLSLQEIDILCNNQQNTYVYVNKDTKETFLKGTQLLPHYMWSKEFKSIHQDLSNGTSIALKDVAERVTDEYLQRLELFGGTHQNLKDILNNYQEALKKGDSSIHVNLDCKPKRGCKQTVKCNLLVEDYLTVEGDLKVNGTVKINGTNAATVPFVVDYVRNNGCNGTCTVTVENLGSGSEVYGIYKNDNPTADTTISLKSLSGDESSGISLEADPNDNIIIIKTNATAGNSAQEIGFNNGGTIVQRDADGNFTANIITASLDGNAANFTGDLDGDVTGKQNETKVEKVGDKTASEIAATVDTVNAATSDATGDTLAKRDGNGNFSAGMISLSGTPTQSTDAATKGYVDSQSGGSASVQNVGSQVAVYKNTTSNPFELRTLQGDSTTGSIVEIDQTNTNRITVKTNATAQSDPNTIVSRDANSKIAVKTLDLIVPALFSAPQTKITIAGDRLLWAGYDGLLQELNSVYVGPNAGNPNQRAQGPKNETAVGYLALQKNDTKDNCTAVGAHALENCNDDENTAVGTFSLRNLQFGRYNTAIGSHAGSDLERGNSNIYVGAHVVAGSTTEDNTIRVGTASHNACYIGGISGKATAGGVPVYVNASGKLGTATSSFDAIEKIKALQETKLAQLRPVNYTVKGDPTVHCGLVPQDAQKIQPEIVQYDIENKPVSINHDVLTVLLLKELQNIRTQIDEQAGIIKRLKKSTRNHKQ